MTNLRELQQALHDFLQKKSNVIESYVIGKNLAEVKRRLSVYQEGYYLRLAANLATQYPVIFLWLKQEKFTKLANDYAEQYPPKDFYLRHYAMHFSDFLTSQDQHCLGELAQFEWAMDIALDDSSDAALWKAQNFQKLTQEALMEFTFIFNPSLQALQLHYDIPYFWQAIKQGKAKTLPAYSQELFYVFVWRKDCQAFFRHVEPLEQQLIVAAKMNKNFTELCEIAAHSLQDQAINFVAQTVLRWLNDGWLVVV